MMHIFFRVRPAHRLQPSAFCTCKLSKPLKLQFHCSLHFALPCLTASQNVTAPKLADDHPRRDAGLTTSQNVTAPKQRKGEDGGLVGLTTSQNVTAPKLREKTDHRTERLTTSQNVTAPKRQFVLVLRLRV